MIKNKKGEMLLLLAAFLWGSGLIIQKLGAKYIPPFTFCTGRAFGGTIALIILAIILKRISLNNKNIGYKIKYKRKNLIMGGILCGIFCFVGTCFQQMALSYIDAGKNGFINSMYIIIIPIIMTFIGGKIKLKEWIAVIIAVVGLYFLCITNGFSLGIGEVVSLIGTLGWTMQIILVSMFSNKTKGLELPIVMMITTGVLSLIASICTEQITLENLQKGMWSVVYAAIVLIGICYALQIIGQRTANATIAGVMLSTEALFAAFFGFFIGERLSTKEIIGGVLITIAVIVAQITIPKKNKHNKQEDLIVSE